MVDSFSLLYLRILYDFDYDFYIIVDLILFFGNIKEIGDLWNIFVWEVLGYFMGKLFVMILIDYVGEKRPIYKFIILY